MARFNYDTFVNLMKTRGIKKAEEYRDWFKTEEIKEENTPLIETEIKKEIKETEQSEEIEINRADLIIKLNTAWVTFYKGAKTEKLVELCIENNLL
jgi:DNA-directed RNA polymerase delta subunit